MTDRRTARALMVLCALLIPLFAGSSSVRAQVEAQAPEPTTLAVDSWLVLGPVDAPLPAFHDAEKHGVKATDLLDSAGLAGAGSGDTPWPDPGDAVPVPGGGTATWSARTAGDGGVELGGAGNGTPRLAWVAVRIDVSRYVEPKLAVRSAHPLRIHLDGEQVAQKGSDAASGDDEESGEGDGEGDDDSGDAAEPAAAEASLKLEPGSHLLLVRTVLDPELADRAWTVSAELSVPAAEDDADDGPAALTLATDPERALTISDLLDVPAVQGAEISADGELVALTLAQPAVPADDRETWVEIRRADDGTLVRTSRGSGSWSGFDWAPEGHRYLFTTSEGEATSLWLGDVETPSAVRLVEGIERFGGARWSPDGSFLVYSASAEEEKDDSGFKRFRELQDRWPGWRDRGSLYQVAVPADPGAGDAPAAPVVRRLTAGEKSANVVDIAPDGSRLLFARTELTTERPFSETELFELELDTLTARPLLRTAWFNGASYAPDGERLLIGGGPSAFGEIGRAVPEGRIPNDYDTQAYLYDLSDGSVEALTEDLDPAVGDAIWSPDGEAIYLQVVDESFSRILRQELAGGAREALDTGVDAVSEMDLSRDGSRLVFVGSSADAPPRVGSLDPVAPATGAEPVTVYRPGGARYEDVRIGRVEDFDFTSSDGTRIKGRVHYPPGFDPETAPEKSVPAIVYYYGGTFPVDRSFGGRYPFNLWAAHGYAVYVLQPSGAVGFGQEFSARHVNDWGEIVTREIIEGTEAFVEAHPFVDPERLGCGGASYGGFTTMYLLTRTDMFRAAFAHAGISDLTSYWGEGWWGFLYSAVATAEAYPWNRSDLYVEQSPIFHADKITTPLLLLHGAADTNVPVGESQQLFTALKLLDREVELVTIEGSNHQIFHYPKRVRWMKTIIAWFDRELKDRPEWWEHLYPAEGGP